MTIDQVFDGFTKKRIAIVGDVMIDAYRIGEVHRMSPEAPVPILNLTSSENRLGGAGNVAMNLKALGATPFLVSVIGNDNDGRDLITLLEKEDLSSAGIFSSAERRTTVKTRIIQNEMHLLRIDSEQTNAISDTDEAKMISLLHSLITAGIDAVIFQDYNKGVLTENDRYLPAK
jgi:D-glycero-beta-D-manno-heptose-7-phosphate kinase